MTHTVHGKPVVPVLGALLLAALAFALSQTTVAPALPVITEEYDTTAASSCGSINVSGSSVLSGVASITSFRSLR